MPDFPGPLTAGLRVFNSEGRVDLATLPAERPANLPAFRSGNFRRVKRLAVKTAITPSTRALPMLKSMLRNNLLTAVCLGALATGSITLLSAPARAADDTGVTGTGEKSFTKPSQEVALDFSSPGLVSEVNVKEGDAVKKGELLARQDASVEAANKAMYEIEGNSRVEEEYAQKDLELKKVKFQRTEGLFKQKKNSAYLEVEEARLEAERRTRA